MNNQLLRLIVFVENPMRRRAEARANLMRTHVVPAETTGENDSDVFRVTRKRELS